MSNPMSGTKFVELLDKWGIPHKENQQGWKNHNRNHKGPWGPDVYGIGNHHTGAADNAAGARVLWYGYAALPGPLCHAGIRQNGTILLNGWGRVNHFGMGDSNVLNHVVMEDYKGNLKPRIADVDGNALFYGFEWMYPGTRDPETHYPEMWRSAVLVNAAICTYHDWTELSSIGHGEWQPGKWDPGYKSGYMIDMSKRFREQVGEVIKEGPPKKKETYKVKKGDNLYSIAKKFNTTITKLVQLNHIDDPDEIMVGTVLKLPGK